MHWCSRSCIRARFTESCTYARRQRSACEQFQVMHRLRQRSGKIHGALGRVSSVSNEQEKRSAFCTIDATRMSLRYLEWLNQSLDEKFRPYIHGQPSHLRNVNHDESGRELGTSRWAAGFATASCIPNRGPLFCLCRQEQDVGRRVFWLHH